ncbi:19497_t:CDS:2, partial [Rhizophagus irregularis]
IDLNGKLFQKLIHEGFRYADRLLDYLEDIGTIYVSEFELNSLADFYYLAIIPYLSILARSNICKKFPISDAISSEQLRDPGVPGVKWFNTFLKKNRFLPETSKPLLPSYLCKLGAVFAVVLNGAKNLSDAMTIASQAFRHSPHNHTSPAQNYTIINF